MQLQTKDQLMMDNAGFKKSGKTLGEIVGLRNCAVAEVKSKSNMYGETNLMITYDVTCQKLPRLALGNSLRQHISPRKVNDGFSKKFETAEIHIFNYNG